MTNDLSREALLQVMEVRIGRKNAEAILAYEEERRNRNNRRPGRGMSNKEFAKSELFVKHCLDANIPSTPRQASKFRNGKGIAFKMMKRSK